MVYPAQHYYHEEILNKNQFSSSNLYGLEMGNSRQNYNQESEKRVETVKDKFRESTDTNPYFVFFNKNNHQESSNK